MTDARTDVWIDTGSGGGFEHRDTRPAHDPMRLLVGVQHLLANQGIYLDPTPNQLYVAMIAASDLLRALGVRPEHVVDGRVRTDRSGPPNG